MKHLEYPYVIAIFVVFLSLANANVENVFSQECGTESLLLISNCNGENINDEVESSAEDNSNSDIPMILPFP